MSWRPIPWMDGLHAISLEASRIHVHPCLFFLPSSLKLTYVISIVETIIKQQQEDLMKLSSSFIEIVHKFEY